MKRLQKWIEGRRMRLLQRIAKVAIDQAIVEWQRVRDQQSNHGVGFVNYLLGTSGRTPYFGLPLFYEALLFGEYEEQLTAELNRQLHDYMEQRKLPPLVDVRGTVSPTSGYRWHAVRHRYKALRH